jgi:NAD+ diphosphatase
MPLDRAATLRDDEAWIARTLADPASRVLAASADGVLVDDTGLARRTLAEAGGEAIAPILLGLDAPSRGAGGSVALFAVDLDGLDPPAAAAITQGGRTISLREAGAALAAPEAGLAAYLTALLNWHRRHGHCANCGAPTRIAEAGYARRCDACAAMHFPRTDPVVIMVVEHAGSVLLGRHAGWPANQYSALAGFVSPGESLEEAVVREVREESGIDCRDPAFVTSQPWPFPTSLMLGFEARSHGGEPQVIDGELEDVRWFTLAEVRSAIGGNGDGRLRVPPSISIARFLLERWARDAAMRAS